jgi:hypothetical protein
MESLKTFFKEQLVEPIKILTFPQIIFAVACGALGGLSPIPGVTTAITVFLCTVARLDLASSTVATAINVMLTPLQLVLMPVFADASLDLKVFVGAATRAELDGTARKPSEQLMTAIESGDGLWAVAQSAGGVIAAATIPWALLTILTLALLKLFVHLPEPPAPLPADEPADRQAAVDGPQQQPQKKPVNAKSVKAAAAGPQ